MASSKPRPEKPVPVKRDEAGFMARWDYKGRVIWRYENHRSSKRYSIVHNGDEVAIDLKTLKRAVAIIDGKPCQPVRHRKNVNGLDVAGYKFDGDWHISLVEDDKRSQRFPVSKFTMASAMSLFAMSLKVNATMPDSLSS